MGEYYIEITTGSPEDEPLPGGSLLVSQDVASLAQMGEPLENVSLELETLLRSVNKLLDDKNRAHISSMVANIDSILYKTNINADRTFDEVGNVSVELQNVAKNINSMMTQNMDAVRLAFEQLTLTMAQAESLMVDLSSTTQNVQEVVGVNEATLHEILQNIETASQNFETLSRNLKEKPWSLVRKTTVPAREYDR